MTWPLAGSEYSKYQRASTGAPLTVTFVAASNALPSVIFLLNIAITGMPTPTEEPSLMLIDTCTGTCTNDADDDADDVAGTVVGLPLAAVLTVEGCPFVLPLVHALNASAITADTARTTPIWRGRGLRVLGIGTSPRYAIERSSTQFGPGSSHRCSERRT